MILRQIIARLGNGCGEPTTEIFTSPLPLTPCAQILDQSWQDRDEDDAKDDQCEVALDDWNIAKQISGSNEDDNPDYSASNIVDEETTVGHPADPGNKWGKGADDRHETGDDNGLSTILKNYIKNCSNLLIIEVKGW